MKEECVVCENFPSQKSMSEEAMASMSDENAFLDMNGDDIDDVDFDNSKKQGRKYRIKSKLIPVPDDLCSSMENNFQHFVHEACVSKLIDKCPRCQDTRARLLYSEQECESNILYCEDISATPGVHGFQSTSKIEEVVAWVKKIPVGDKAILYSFFKSTLDLIEGVIVDHLGLNCARFDGDSLPINRSEELDRFKKSDKCRILLATVQSSGTGLNIIEANHVGFIDRWFNPCVHAQAEDRVST